MSISRRGFLRAGAGVGAAAAVGAASWAVVPKIVRPGEPGLLLPSAAPLPQPYRAYLPIPPELAPVASDATTDYYEIVQRTAHLDILPGLRTESWTYHGSFPGPTIRARSGRATAVRHHNQLPHPTVVHLHGGHTPADSDGYPMDLILPVGSTTAPQHHGHGAATTMTGALAHGERTYLYPNRQRAATLWYHDHRHSFTGPAVWRGLAGFHLVGDDVEDALPLPRGDRDIPLLISDRSFAADGSFAYPLIDPDLRTPGVTDPYRTGFSVMWCSSTAHRGRGWKCRRCATDSACSTLRTRAATGSCSTRPEPVSCRSAVTEACWTGRSCTITSIPRRPNVST
ncbi:multicopper oxidase family protein [Nocardia cyriacigeorgica]|uniref:multicopper oxidase family protein n=1 Tax=Nocardia cyriacigeorgica TaxID=135487 RepID=UPI001E32604F|nr:multicopper oxidase domain-containing protein [Nocardia cyriacigeorgica]